MGLIADAALFRLEIKLQQMIVATPTSPLAYALGLSLSTLVYSMPGLAIFTALLWLYHSGGVELLALLFTSLVLLWYSTSTISFTVSTTFRDVKYTWAIANIMTFILGIVPPVYYTASSLGDLDWLAYLTPTSAAAYVLHQYMGLTHYPPLGLALSIVSLLGYSLLGTVMTLRVARWRTP
jgi:ABC-2 type transport system permease protein